MFIHLLLSCLAVYFKPFRILTLLKSIFHLKRNANIKQKQLPIESCFKYI